MQRILFPIDFSPRVESTAPLVAALAKRSGAEVNLLHVLSYTPEVYGAAEYVGMATDLVSPETLERWKADRMERLNRFMVDAWQGVRVTRQVEAGDIAGCILAAAESGKPDLIMMPTHGYGPFRRMLLGSVTAKILHDAKCDIWTDAHADSPDAWRPETLEEVLCAVDLEDDAASIHVIQRAKDFAKPSGARLTVLHAMPAAAHQPGFPDLPGDILRTVEDRIWEMAQRADATAKVHVEGGWPVEALRRVSAQKRPDLLVLGRGKHRGLGRLGSHAYAMIREAPCPVLSVV